MRSCGDCNSGEHLWCLHEWSPRTRGGVSRRDSPTGAFVLRGLSVRTRLLGERGTTTRREVERRQRVQRN
jgi:hypothetical protein